MSRVLINCVTKGIGNAVLLTPLIELAKRKYGKVDVVVSDSISRIIFENNSNIDKTIIYTSPASFILHNLRAYDIIISPDYSMINISLRAIMPKKLLTCTPLKLNTNRKLFFDYSWLGTSVYKTMNNEHESLTNCRVVDHSIGIEQIPKPKVYPRRENILKADTLLSKLVDKKKTLFCFHVGSSDQTCKRYPLDRYSIIITKILHKYNDIEILLLGGKSEFELLESVRNGVLDAKIRSRIHIITEPLNVALSILKKCNLLVGNDSGLAHAASALGVTTLVIFGPTNERRTSPLHNVIQVYHNVPCRPCYNIENSKYRPDKCPFEYRCLNLIEANHVVKKIEDFVDKQS